MASDEPDPPETGESPAVRGIKPQTDAFDLWLQRGLHELFDDIANEPVPEALLKIIEAGRPK